MLEALMQFRFLQHAVISAILASIACGIIGTIIMEKKMIMMSGGIAHASFGGIGLGYYLNIEPIIGALFFSLLSSLGIAALYRKAAANTDILIGMFWSLGMALGILFIYITPGYPPDMTSYLFGDILTVSQTDLFIITILDSFILLIITAFFHQFKSYIFDEDFSVTLGIPVIALEYLLFILIGLTVVILIRVVGIILIIALLSAPPSIAKIFANDIKSIMILAASLGSFFCLAGLSASYYLQIPSGAAIIIVSVFSYLLTALYKSKRLAKEYAEGSSSN